MIEILVYAFGIMYTPGPSNLVSLNAGMNGTVRPALGFCAGVAFAMFLLFLLFGYTSVRLVSPEFQLVISCLGSLYITYLAFNIVRAGVSVNESTPSGEEPGKRTGFRTGLIMQLLNPKSFVAILPIVTVQFPAEGISGLSVLFWSLLLSCLAFGAPGSYLLMGIRLGKLVQNPRIFSCINLMLGGLLFYVAGDIAYSHVYLKLI